jgi:hypothetical protein
MTLVVIDIAVHLRAFAVSFPNGFNIFLVSPPLPSFVIPPRSPGMETGRILPTARKIRENAEPPMKTNTKARRSHRQPATSKH